jgi:hypothetical protein
MRLAENGIKQLPIQGPDRSRPNAYKRKGRIATLFVFYRARMMFLNFVVQIKTMDQQNPVPPAQPNQLNIEISEEVAEGNYANLAIITHSHAEFVIDFVNVMPGTPKSKVKSRIILTPQHAKRLMKALTENIGRYEAANGAIKDLEEVQIPFNFGGPAAQA